MSKRAHPTLIGLFVLGAIVLLLVVLLFVAGGRIFRETRQGVMRLDRFVSHVLVERLRERRVIP